MNFLYTTLTILLQDFANPLVHPHLHFYPEELDGLVTEVWHGEKWHTFLPGEALYTIVIDEWNDDVSGNWSKLYNKHFNTYIANRNLPRKLLQQEFHVHFLGTSQFATVTEQNAAVKQMIIYAQHLFLLSQSYCYTGNCTEIRFRLLTV